MKKISILLVTLALAVSLCSCAGPKLPFGDSLSLEDLLAGGNLVETALDVTTAEPEEFIATEIAETTVPVETTSVIAEEPVSAEQEISIGTQWLGLDGGDYGWYVSWQRLSLSDADAEKYPKLAVALERINAGNYEYASEQAEGFAEFALDEEFAIRASEMYDTNKFDVLRADGDIISIRNDTDGYYGGVHGYYASYGYNFDPVSGEVLTVSTVVADMKMLYDIIGAYLFENYKDEVFTTAEELYNDYGDDLEWVIDNEKLTVYFNPYEIASYATGIVEVEIPFDRYAGVFNTEYID